MKSVNPRKTEIHRGIVNAVIHINTVVIAFFKVNTALDKLIYHNGLHIVRMRPAAGYEKVTVNRGYNTDAGYSALIKALSVGF